MASITWEESTDSNGNFYAIGECGDYNKRSFTIECRPEANWTQGNYGLFFNGEFVDDSDGDEEWARGDEMKKAAQDHLESL